MKKFGNVLILNVIMLTLLFLSGCDNKENKSGNDKPAQKNGAAESKKTDVDVKKELGALWEDLKAEGQEVYSKLRDKKFVIPIAIECIFLRP